MKKDVSTLYLEFPDNIDKLLDQLFQLLEDTEFFRKSFSPTLTSADCETARSDQQGCIKFPTT